PLSNISIHFLKMRRTRVDLLQHFGCPCIILENRQRGDVRFFACERLEFFMLPRRLLLGPGASRVSSDCFYASRSGGDGFFFHDAERPNLACRPHVCAAAELHRITVKPTRRSADLQDANCVTVLFAEKLNDLFSLFCFREWNLSPRNWRVLDNFFVH